MMRLVFALASCAAIGLMAAPLAEAQGPVRQGLRRTGEIAVEGTRRVVQGAADGTRAVVGGAAEGTRAVVGGAAQGTRAVVGGAADVTRGVVGGAARGIGAVTPDLPLQARAGANLSAADAGRDARWRFAQHNGEWWYYSPQNQWMYHRDGQWSQFSEDSFQRNQQLAGAQGGQFQDGQYAAGYRGLEQGGQQYSDQGAMHAQGPAHTLYRDEQGREYICENGQRVYFEGGQQGFQDQQGMNNWDGQQGQTPHVPTDPNAQGYGSAQGYNQGTPGVPTAPTGGAANQGQGQAGDEATATQGAGQDGAIPGQATGPGPESPREINNEPPSPAASGQPGTSGTGDGDTLQ